MRETVVAVEGLRHDYAGRPALRGIDFEVGSGEIFGMLGPNGGGKTTLFRILATLLRPTAGRALVLGHDVLRDADVVRAGIGVVFQSPALDRMLSVRDNLAIQGRLYGLSGARLAEAVRGQLRRFRLDDRAGDRVDTLSGGLKRRAEIAKGLMHRPRLLLLDEPSTGLDPAARKELWDHLAGLRDRDGVTVVATTHLLEEAERCDRLAILSEGALVACGAPRDLKAEIGGDVLVITTADPQGLRDDIERRMGFRAVVVDGSVRLEAARGHELVPRLAEAFAGRIDALTLGRPTLLDVFIHRTGHRFREEERP